MTKRDQSAAAGEARASWAHSEPFTPALQAFFKGAANWPWEADFPKALFIRDYHNLPVSSPYDIDLMMDANLQEPFVALVRRMADKHGLHCTAKLATDVCFIMLSDLDASAKGRAWAFLETRESIRFAPNLSISAGDVDIVKDQSSGLPVPGASWKAFLEIAQGVRTGKTGKAEQVLRALGIQPAQAEGLFQSLLGLDVELERTLEQSQDALDKIGEVIIRKSKKPERPTSLAAKSRLNRFLFCSCYFHHRGRPLFFTIHGPDGVGKTTTCTEVEKIFARLPLPFSSFHHITGWKHDMKAAQRKAAEKVPIRGSKEWRPGLLHLMMRWVYRRLLPEAAQRSYVLVQGYDMYLRKLNAMIYSGYCRDRIMFVDRYIYDMATKNIIQGYGQGWIHRIFVRLARPPMRAFILTDGAEAIRTRKQELTLDEIRSYQEIMDRLMSRRGVKFEQIEVGGRTPQTIAREICQKILDDCSFALLVLLRTGKTEADIARSKRK